MEPKAGERPITLTVTEKELAMICDALYTTGGNYRRDSQPFMYAAGARYEELARELSLMAQRPWVEEARRG